MIATTLGPHLDFSLCTLCMTFVFYLFDLKHHIPICMTPDDGNGPITTANDPDLDQATHRATCELPYHPPPSQP
jgi:hypothetical protein